VNLIQGQSESLGEYKSLLSEQSQDIFNSALILRIQLNTFIILFSIHYRLIQGRLLVES
jgi:hypothetical protein